MLTGMERASVVAYVGWVDRALAAAEAVFPLAANEPTAIRPVDGAAAREPGGSSQLETGVRAAASHYRGAWAHTRTLDEDTTNAVAAGTSNGQHGREAAGRIRRSAALAASSMVPVAHEPSGVRQLVSTMDQRLRAMQDLLAATKAQNSSAAEQMRTTTVGYRTIPAGHVSPQPPPVGPSGNLCWIGSKDGDIKRLCPDDTDTVTYVDDNGNYVRQDLSSGQISIVHRPGPITGDPSTCWLPHAGADRAICGPRASTWMYPHDGSLITEELGPDGKVRVTFQTPLGPLNP
ncbi:hypothetical protein Mycch_5415 (plasmid) [Mycolicibacterium chubuense NBB4]|uniref:Uncharacterized protein n=1 Tax=Mycolicibacterium chubuense (strain NBB4) TaxID=710421 RepID=I4BS32_MYCCN|nr:hypothetical protein Mycch_5415 [Mycolicibacterium chubuense NBB4]